MLVGQRTITQAMPDMVTSTFDLKLRPRSCKDLKSVEVTANWGRLTGACNKDRYSVPPTSRRTRACGHFGVRIVGFGIGEVISQGVFSPVDVDVGYIRQPHRSWIFFE